MSTKLKSGQKILFIGDSITDAGRRNTDVPLGHGYVALFSEMMMSREPQKKIEIVNKGISGDNVVGLRNRWTDDVLNHQPDWLSVKIGINDLHQGLLDMPDAITPEIFEEAYDEILTRTRKTLPKCKILLIDPFYISRDKCPNSRRFKILSRIPKFTSVVARMSRKYKTKHIKTHEIFQKLLKFHDGDKFCPEPVHPHRSGHLVIADAVYDALSE